MDKKISKFKYFLFSLFPLIGTLLLMELGLRAAYYQKKSSYTFAISYGLEEVKHRFIEKAAKNKVNDLIQELNALYFKQNIIDRLAPDIIDKKIHESLYSDIGENALKRFKKVYEENFSRLVTEVQKVQSKLVILYIPTAEKKHSERLKICSNFFKNIAVSYGIDFVDLTDRFYQYPYHWVTLFPENDHLSRLGNILIADELSAYIENHGFYYSQKRFKKRNKLFGDLPKSLKEMMAKGTSLEYLLVTNSQGLRMNYDLFFPKKKQRVLILGDSLTFGPYLQNQYTFSGILESRYRYKEIINAGVCGYTIDDELGLFIERAKYSEPDITVLQVLDNDLYGMIFFKKKLFSRKKGNFLPSEEEIEFLKRIRFDNDDQKTKIKFWKYNKE